MSRCGFSIIDAANGDAYDCTLPVGHKGRHEFDTYPSGRDALVEMLRAAEARASAAEAESERRGALLDEAVTLLSGPITSVHRVPAQPFWICTCEAEADSDYPTGSPCTCPRPEAKHGCVDGCPACASKRARTEFVERARAALSVGETAAHVHSEDCRGEDHAAIRTPECSGLQCARGGFCPKCSPEGTETAKGGPR